MEFAEYLKAVREKEPLVQCITNFVTVNDCANILLAVGGSPMMTQDSREVEEAVERADALVCNLGAVEFVQSMCLAGKWANQLKKPVVIDPVAAGGTQLRRDTMQTLLSAVQFAAIRGNASEIRAIAGQHTTGSGVDVSGADAVTEENLKDMLVMVRNLAEQLKTVIVISGKLDLVSDGKKCVVLKNGCATMARITGSGCMLTTLLGAFIAAAPQKPLEAACAAVAAMGIAGEIAEEKRLQNKTGNATFRNDLIDAIFNLTEKQLEEGANYEIYKG